MRPRALRDRLGTLHNLPRLFALVWRTSPSLALATVGLRLSRAVLPTAALYIGKLIIDAVVAETRLPSPGPALGDWIASGRLGHIATLVVAEAALAILSDLLGRASTLVSDLLAQRYSDRASVMLMRHAATLDLEQFESSDQQDKLDRARRQVTGRSSVLQLIFGQAQDAVTVLVLAAGFTAYAPWLCCCWPWRSCPPPWANCISIARATGSTSRGRRSAGRSTTCAISAPASRPPRR